MKKALIVEDDVDTLDMMEIILRDAGYAAITVRREITINEIAAIAPHLVILDCFLSVKLGTVLCSELKDDPRTRKIPVILYSASNNVEQLARDCRADGFIAKPFDIDTLTDLITLVVR